MVENQYSFLMFNTSKSNNEESSDSDKKRTKNFNLRSFDRFKPKQIKKEEKDIEDIEDAENKVISLLSDYLKNIKLEKKNDNSKNLNYKYSTFNRNQRKKVKRNTCISNINCKNQFKNDYDNNKKLHLNFNMNSSKKNNNKFSTFITSKRKEKLKSNIDNIFNSINNKPPKIKVKLIEKNKKTQTNSSKSFKKFKDKYCEEEKIEKKISKEISNITDSKHLKSSLNSKNESSVQDNNNKSINRNQINEKDELFNKIIKKQDKKSRNNIFNESFHNSMMSEGSQYNINQKSFEINNDNKSKINNASVIYSKNNRLAINSPGGKKSISNNKRNTMIFSEINFKNMINKVEPEFKKNNINNKKELINNNEEKLKINKILKNNVEFKSIREKLKDSLILRPEEFQSSQRKKVFNDNNKSNIKISNILITKRSNQTVAKNFNMKNINKTINTINLGYINKDEILKKNNSEINNKSNLNFSQFTEKNNKKEEKKKKSKSNENETEKTLKTTKTNKTNNIEISNNLNPSFKIFSKNGIQRKNTLYLEKLRKITHKPNLYDSLDDEELEDEDDGTIIYLDPNSNFVLLFDGILFLVSIISFIQNPFYLAMTHNFCRKKKITLVSGINIITELLYICDLILGFFRAYYNWEEQLICRHRNIIKKYLTEWFIFDLISAMPIYIISKLCEPYCNDYELSSSYYNIILKNLNYVLISNKLIKLIKVHMSNQAIKVISNKLSDNYKMIFYVFLVLCTLNYAACLYIFIARNCYPNWILQARLGTHPFIDIYICSIYIIIMALTTVGYGDITCYCFHERIYQLFLLIVGIMAYSYAVSAISNYIQKINERSADFTKKKSILDEIKLSNPNVPDYLYDRILKHLFYKNKHEKKLKNLIFDCLPVSLKNDLISEMYKPIINKFIFFKNFQNKDFIVSVILGFKAVIAFKNDILVNEGDRIEDIIFVKKGALSVELPINITNPQKNIDKYLNTQLLEMNNTQNLEKKDNSVNNLNISWSKNNNHLNNLNNNNLKEKKFNKENIHSSTIIGSNFQSSKISIIDVKPSFLKREKANVQDEIRYVKILGIRNNEHFGDVLMFLEKRSPLRLRVRSKKSELFFLKKIDALKISHNHPNIWRNINKKSIYNYEQIKKYIINIVEIYCSVKINNKLKKAKSNSDSIYDDLISKTKKVKKISKINIHHIKTDLKKSTLKFNKETRRSKSLNNSSNKNFENIFIKQKIYISFEENNNKYKYFSLKKLQEKYNLDNIYSNRTKLKFSPSSSSSSSIVDRKKNKRSKHEKSKKHRKKYKNYQRTKRDKSHKEVKLKKAEKKNKREINQIYNKKEEENINSLINTNISKNKNNNNNNLLNIKRFSSSSKTLKMDKSYSYHFFNNDNSELIEDNEESESNITSNQISNEIHSGEEIKINKENNSLFNKKYNILSKNKINILLNNNIDNKNSKIKILLNSFVKEYDLIDEESKKYSNKSLNNDINIKNNISKKKFTSSFNSQSDEIKKKEKKFKNCNLSIDNKISLLFESSYDNFNLISKENLIKNKSLQERLKKFLINEIIELTYSNRHILKNKYSLIESNNKESSKTKYQSSMIPIEKNENSVMKSMHYSPLTNKVNKKTILKSKNHFELNLQKPSYKKKVIFLSASFKENSEKNKKLFNDDMNNDNKSVLIRKKTMKKRFASNRDLVNPFSSELIHKKILRKKSPKLLSPGLKLKKRESNNLLSQIDFNIEKTNQNLNNPDIFYSNFFNYLLEEKIKEREKKNDNLTFIGQPINDEIESKKEKIIKRKSTGRKVKNNND